MSVKVTLKEFAVTLRELKKAAVGRNVEDLVYILRELEATFSDIEEPYFMSIAGAFSLGQYVQEYLHRIKYENPFVLCIEIEESFTEGDIDSVFIARRQVGSENYDEAHKVIYG